jgi:hypothetical protein
LEIHKEDFYPFESAIALLKTPGNVQIPSLCLPDVMMQNSNNNTNITDSLPSVVCHGTEELYSVMMKYVQQSLKPIETI